MSARGKLRWLHNDFLYILTTQGDADLGNLDTLIALARNVTP